MFKTTFCGLWNVIFLHGLLPVFKWGVIPYYHHLQIMFLLLPLTAKRIDTSPLWTFCSYFPSLLHYSLWIIFVFLIVFDTLAYSLVNDLKSGDHRLDSISGHYQSPDMNTHTRTFSHFLLKKTYFFARYKYTNWQTPFCIWCSKTLTALQMCIFCPLSYQSFR